jgi:hypothetical protein
MRFDRGGSDHDQLLDFQLQSKRTVALLRGAVAAAAARRIRGDLDRD